MKSLLVLRHAKSSWRDMSLSDHERPLNRRGKRDAPRMGNLLRELELIPELIISSTAKRALDTAGRVAEACGYEREILSTRGFFHGDIFDYLYPLKSLDKDIQRVMIVGHNPGMEYLIEELTGEYLRFTTANIAHIQLPIQQWSALDDEVEGSMLGLWRPKEL